jgi:branched-chain amino acid transport system substrate-binding protein
MATAHVSRRTFKENLEHVMASVSWPNVKSPRAQRVAAEFMRRTGSKSMDETSFSYDGIQVIADVLERARSTDPEALVDAIKKTNFTDPIMVSADPIRFDEIGENIDAATAMVQILENTPQVVWPRDAAHARLVFPRPKG